MTESRKYTKAHDDDCEAEYVVGAAGYTDCGCRERSSRPASDYQARIAGETLAYVEQKLLNISPFLVDIERRERQEAEAREMIAATWPIVEPAPALPHQQYPTPDERAGLAAALEEGGREIAKRTAREADLRLAWTIPVYEARALVGSKLIPSGIPISGDHRRFVDAGWWPIAPLYGFSTPYDDGE